MAKYRVGQAAQLLGVSVDTLRRWASAGRVAVTVAPDGRRYYDGEDLAKLAVEIAGDTTFGNVGSFSTRSSSMQQPAIARLEARDHTPTWIR